MVKPQGAPPGFVKLEQPKSLGNWPALGQWSLAVMDAQDCDPATCNPARLTLQRMWEGSQRLPRDRVELVWYSPDPVANPGPFSVQVVAPEFQGISEAGWFVEGDWQRWSHSVLIVDPTGQLVAWVRPPFNVGQIVRSMSLAGID